VTRKSEGSDPANGLFTVEMILTGRQNHPIAAGMFGKALISPAKSTEAWSIPYDALLDGDATQGYVFVTEDNRKVKKIRVSIASISKDNVKVISGLENAKSLIVSGSAYLTDGSAIRVIENQ
jgi:multidrug efflux pump subunit AcrA (membrane-fusion protein)